MNIVWKKTSIIIFLAFIAGYCGGSLHVYYNTIEELEDYKGQYDAYAPTYKKQAEVGLHMFRKCMKRNDQLRQAYRKRTNCM